MKDQEALTLKAFLAALANQSAPFPTDLQTQLNQIDTNDHQYLVELDRIARHNPFLKESYLTARKLLDSPEERNKGRASSPDSTIEKQNLEDMLLENTIQLHENTSLENLVQKIEKVNNKDLLEIAIPIIKSANSLKAVQDDLPKFLVSLPS